MRPHRLAFSCFGAFWFALLIPTAVAAQSENETVRSQIEELAEGLAAEVADEQLERARELLRQADLAQTNGSAEQARAILSLLPLQLRLVREVVEAFRIEGAARDAEQQIVVLRERRRAARERLERLLEHLAALRQGRGEGP